MRIVFLFLILLSCRGEEKASLPKEELKEITLTETRRGEKLWSLRGKEVKIEEERIFLKDISMNFFKNNKSILSLEASLGDVERKSLDIFLKDVKIKSIEGFLLKTSSIFWENERSLLTSPSEVILKREGVNLKAENFSFSLEKGEVYLKKPRITIK